MCKPPRASTSRRLPRGFGKYLRLREQLRIGRRERCSETLSRPVAAAAYDCAASFLASHDPQQPGCLLLDIRMAGMSGLDLQQVLNRGGCIAPIIFITGHADVPMTVEAMQQGAFDFLQKPFRDQELLDRVMEKMHADSLAQLFYMTHLAVPQPA